MSFQAYLDGAEKKTGRTPQQILDLIEAQGFTAESKAGDVRSRQARPPRAA